MTTKAEILRVIRENCIDCVVGAISTIEDCGGEEDCKLYPYRFGKDPKPSRKGNPEALEKARSVTLQSKKKSVGRTKKENLGKP